MIAMARYYLDGLGGIQPDHSKAIEILKRAAELGSSEAHCKLGDIY
jgi:TPR repeat protein